MRTTSYNKM